MGTRTESQTAACNLFDTSHLKDHLKQHSVRGGAHVLMGRIVSQVVQIGSIAVLARLLSPTDYGLLAMVTALTGFMQQFSSLGLSHATVQQSEVTHEQVSTLFWVNVGFSVLVTLFFISFAPLIAWLYGEPQLFWLTIVLSFGFLLSGLSVQHQALMQRQMRFGQLAWLNIVRVVVSISVGIVVAWQGAGVWALATIPLVSGFVFMVGVWLCFRWCPGWPVRGCGVRKMLVFGGNLTGFNILNYFSRNLDNVLIGWYWGAGPLGFYNRAYRLLLLPIRQFAAPVASVAIPTLSRLQNEPERYERYYLKAVSLIATVSFPFVIYLIMMSESIILLVLGPKWTEVSVLFSVLGISAFFQPVAGTSGWLFVSFDRTQAMLKWGVISSVLIAISFVIGLPYGILGVAWAYTICYLLLVFPALAYSTYQSPVRFFNILKTLWRPLLSVLSMVLATQCWKNYFPMYSVGVMGLLIVLIGSVGVYLAMLCLLVGNWSPVTDVMDLARQIRRKKD